MLYLKNFVNFGRIATYIAWLQYSYYLYTPIFCRLRESGVRTFIPPAPQKHMRVGATERSARFCDVYVPGLGFLHCIWKRACDYMSFAKSFSSAIWDMRLGRRIEYV